MVMDELYHEERQIVNRKSSSSESPATAFVFDDRALQRSLKRIYEKRFNPMTEIEENLFNETFRIIHQATLQGLGDSGVEVPEAFRQKVELGNAVFSAFKVHRMQNDIATQLYDSNGVLKPFEQWRKDVHPMLDHHVEHWLRTEYNTAVIRARQAADWQRFEQYADILPNLEWMPSTSINPGADHRVYWGTILPIHHPFWAAHRPGDRWNCKCSLSATDKPSTGVPRRSNTPEDQPAPGLDNNPGVDGKLFSDTHPYITNAYEGAKEAVKTFMKDKFPDYARMKIEPKHSPDGKYSERTKELKKEAAQTVKGIALNNKDFSYPVLVSQTAIKEWLNQPHKHYAHKNEMILKIKDVFKKSKYLGSVDKYKDIPGLVQSHLFETHILGDKSWIIVREYEDRSFRLYSITDSDKLLQFLKKERS